jgi:hypothetical protein
MLVVQGFILENPRTPNQNHENLRTPERENP